MPGCVSFGCFGKRRRIANEFSAKVFEISTSEYFRASEVINSRIHLSQAFMLFWQDWFTGDVDGLWSNSSLLAGVYSCVLLELIALGKITLKETQVFGESTINIKVLDHELTNSYLDEAAFCGLLRQDASHDQATLAKSISQAVQRKCCSRSNCATMTLKSLEEMEILRRREECFGLTRQYCTVNLEPRGRLEKKIRLTALKSGVPDCYTRILLTMASMADSYAYKRDRLLKYYFTKNEHKRAIARIETLSKEWSSGG